MKWKYNHEIKAYLVGDSKKHGAGVFLEKEEWTGNVISNGVIYYLPYYITKKEAMKEAEELLLRIKEEINE